jgi:hypothetical protein
MEQSEPRIIQARFEGKCAKCNGKIAPLSSIIHYPSTKETYHAGCGREAYQTFWSVRLHTAVAAYNALQNIL